MRKLDLLVGALVSLVGTASFAKGNPEAVFVEANGAILAGTLPHPENDLHGVIVMVTGSGPHSRDQIIAGNPMFAEIAEMLAEAGWASLRVDE